VIPPPPPAPNTLPSTTPADSTAPAQPATPTTTLAPGAVRVASGTQANEIAAALHAVQTPAADIAAIFTALRDAGALSAEIVVR
jgi:flagellar basal body P-ring protein FlgI